MIAVLSKFSLRLAPVALLASAACFTPAVSARTERTYNFAPFFKGHTAAFVLKDVRRGKIYRLNPKRCRTRFSPCSTFKIPNSLIGLDTGAVPSPEFQIKWDGQKRPIEPWNRDHTMRTAMPNSVVWYYQEVARRIGPERMRKYVDAFGYGNRDLSGGIDQFWLSNTLAISPDEQIAFLEKLNAGKLPVKPRTRAQVLDLMVLSKEKGRTFRGKTGTAGSAEKDLATMGWFIGSVEKAGERYLFAATIEGGENPSGRTARRIVERALKAHGLL